MDFLSESELEMALSDLKGWEVKDDKLTKLYKFKNFREAMTFLVRLAFEVEEMNQHPEIENVYNQIRFSLTTHYAGNKVTGKDLKLACRIDDLL
jgi:4a-hydroxytetrahydrobiopterin dehydratase